MNKIAQLNFGLFWRPRNFFHNIRIYFKRRRYLLKHGYPEIATWECFEYFRQTWIDILTEYGENLHGAPMGFESCEEWKSNVIDKMIADLQLMDIDNGNSDKAVTAKKEFFQLFSEYFYDLWD